MKLIQKIRNTLKRLPRVTVATILATSLLAVPVSRVAAEFYPDRPVYDYNDPAQRVGSTTGPVFNSFINTPSYGDERSFFDARRNEDTGSGSFHNVSNSVLGGSKEYILRIYIHNNANQNTNGTNFDGAGVATGAKVKVFLPTATASSLRARAYISANNATMVEDTVDFTDSTNFSVEYVPGSAVLYNNGPFVNGRALSDNIVTTGATIGYDALNGKIPGCFDYESTVQLKIKVKPVTPTPTSSTNLSITKKVRKVGESAWVKEVAAKPGENVEWLVTTLNTGTTVQNNIVVRDVLPPNVKLVSGSVRWIDVNQNVAQSDGPLFNGGIDVGNYAGNGGFYMMFRTTVLDNFTECQVRNRNLAYSRSNQTPEISDSADVVITKENCKPTTTTPISTSKPSSLPKTGSASVIGIFAATTLAAGFAHRYWMSRRYSA